MSGWRPPSATVEGLKYRLRELERAVMDLQRIRGGAGGSERVGGSEVASGGGVPTFLVAANNASDRTKGYADWVCDGTDDDVEILAAFASGYTGGVRVVLSEGEFWTSATITMGWGDSLVGMDRATMINSTATTAISGVSGGSVSDLVLYGPDTGSSVGVTLAVDGAVRNCEIGACDTGVSVAGLRGRVDDCDFYVCNVYDIDVSGTLAFVTGNQLKAPMRFAGDHAMVLGNYLDSTATVTVTGSNNCLAHNYLSNGALDLTDSGTNTNLGTNFSNGGPW